MFNSTHTKNAQEGARRFSAAQTADDGAPLVLLVEDDADSRFTLRYLLKMWNYRVVEAQNGAEAVKAAEIYRPDLILMEDSLPDADGFVVARHIRGCADLDCVPIVFLSGHSPKASGGESKHIEIASYFVKPVGADELERAVRKHCGALQKAA